MRFKNSLFLLFIFCFLSLACKKKVWREDPNFLNPELEAKLKESKTIILSNQKTNYTFPRGFQDRNEAVHTFLNEIKIDRNKINSYITWDEQLHMIFPNTYGLGTALDYTPLDDYKILLMEREKIAKESMYAMVSNGFKVLKIEWETPRRMKQIIGHKPKIFISSSKGKFEITQIKMIYEIDGKFIVGVLGP